MGPQVQDTQGNTVLELSIKIDAQLQDVGNQLTSLTVIAFYLDRLFQLGNYYIQKLSNVIYIGSIYKGKAICSSVNKGGYINSISILRYYIQSRKVFPTY